MLPGTGICTHPRDLVYCSAIPAALRSSNISLARCCFELFTRMKTILVMLAIAAGLIAGATIGLLAAGLVICRLMGADAFGCLAVAVLGILVGGVAGMVLLPVAIFKPRTALAKLLAICVWSLVVVSFTFSVGLVSNSL